MSVLISATTVHDGSDEVVYVHGSEQFLRSNGWILACEASTEGVSRLLTGLRSTIASPTR